jgi:hypothetical protein
VDKQIKEMLEYHGTQTKMYKHLIADTKRNVFKILLEEIEKTRLTKTAINYMTGYNRL